MLRTLYALVALCLIIALPAVELTLASPGWSDHAAAEAKPACTRANGQAIVTVSAAHYARCELPCPSDGSDDAPLRIDTRLAITAEGPLHRQPGLLTLVWPTGLFAIGVVPSDGDKTHVRTAIARWIDGSKRGETVAAVELPSGAVPAFLRLIVTARDVSAWTSSDGWSWQRLLTMPRSGGAFASAPTTIALGKGWPDDKQGTSLDAKVEFKGKNPQIGVGTYSFLSALIANTSATLPSSQFPDYAKVSSREDSLEALRALSIPRQGWLCGPCPARQVNDLTPFGPETKAFNPADAFPGVNKDKPLAWKEHRIGDGPNDHIVLASSIIPGDKGQARCAATIIECREPRHERFLFDGNLRIALYVNSQLIAHERQDERSAETEADRHVVVAPLVAGRNSVVVVVTADNNGTATFTLRHDAGDPRLHIQLNKRLAIDFPDDVETASSTLLETARLWEQLGYAAEAVRASQEAASLTDAPPEQVEAALFERARFHAQLRDQAACESDIREMQQKWSADADIKPLYIAQRTAQLWLRLNQADKALALLRDAAKLPGLSDDDQAELTQERLRLVAAARDPAAVLAEMRAIIDVLPTTSVLRGMLFAELASRLHGLGQANDRELQAALTSTDTRVLRRTAGIAAESKQTAMWLAALTAVAALPTTGPFDSPLIALAEARAVSGDTPGAIAAYRQALAQLPTRPATTGTADESLATLRVAFIRATLSEQDAGISLLRQAAAAPTSTSPLLSAVILALAKPDQREDIANALYKGSEDAYQNGQHSEAAVLVRLLFRAFPECGKQTSDVCVKFGIWPFPWQSKDPDSARSALLWYEGSSPLLPKGVSGSWHWRLAIARKLIEQGEFTVAIQCINTGLWVTDDIQSRIEYLAGLGELYVSAGYPERAAWFYKRIQEIGDLQPIDERTLRSARGRLIELGRMRGVNQNTVLAFTGTALLRSAQAAVDSGNMAEAIAAYHKLIATSPGQAVRQTGGRARGMVTWCAEQLRRLPGAEVATYRRQVGPTVTRALAQARNQDDAVALERLAIEHPLAGEAGEALILIARRYLACGADALAAGTIERLVREFTLPEPTRSELLVAALRAAVRVNDRAVFARLTAEFIASAKPVVDGNPVDAKAWSSELGQQLNSTMNDALPTAAIGVAPLALTAEQVRDTRRFISDGGRTVHVVPRAGIGNGCAYVHSGVDGVLLDLASGAVRWRTTADRLFNQGKIEANFPGLSDMGTVVVGSRCVARTQRNGRWCLEARDTVTGSLVWSSETLSELAGLTVCSSPSSDGYHAIAICTDGTALRIVAIALSTGRLAWLTPLTVRATDLGFAGRPDSGFELAAPTIAGRDGYCATDGGAVLSFDCGSGAVRWITTYVRSSHGEQQGAQAVSERLRRPPSRVQVGNESVVVLPRDTLALLCFARSDGSKRWQRDFPACRLVTGLATAQNRERVITQGSEVQCLDATSGGLIWRWQPVDDVTIGCGALTANSVFVATAAAL
ncbi:MAG: PQQ-binding-like beta-propeller repeat protein, partial [Planctomycetota bacterium]